MSACSGHRRAHESGQSCFAARLLGPVALCRTCEHFELDAPAIFQSTPENLGALFIYDRSRLVARVNLTSPRLTWKRACSLVRYLARTSGHRPATRWFTTANRCGFECGEFHAVPFYADVPSPLLVREPGVTIR